MELFDGCIKATLKRQPGFARNGLNGCALHRAVGVEQQALLPSQKATVGDALKSSRAARLNSAVARLGVRRRNAGDQKKSENEFHGVVSSGALELHVPNMAHAYT